MYVYVYNRACVCVCVCVCKWAHTYKHALMSVELICMGIYNVVLMCYLGVEMGGG